MTLMDAEQGHCDICDARPPEGSGFADTVKWIAYWQMAHPMDYGYVSPDHELDTPTTDGQCLEDAEMLAYRDYEVGVK